MPIPGPYREFCHFQKLGLSGELSPSQFLSTTALPATADASTGPDHRLLPRVIEEFDVNF